MQNQIKPEEAIMEQLLESKIHFLEQSMLLREQLLIIQVELDKRKKTTEEKEQNGI